MTSAAKTVFADKMSALQLRDVEAEKASRSVDNNGVVASGFSDSHKAVGNDGPVKNRIARFSQEGLSSEERQNQLVDDIAASYRNILLSLGEDADRDGLLKTPKRAAKALLFCTQGYNNSVTSAVNDALSDEIHEEMVVIKDIEMFSMCEHHMMPFMGKVSVAYLPQGKLLGLSKVARIVDIFSRRLQVQERLTNQIAQALVEAVNPAGVAVIIEAAHMCMVMRGVQQINSKTITTCTLGEFRSNPKMREEMLQLFR